MAEQEKVKKQSKTREDEAVEESTPEGQEKGEKIKADIDDLLDEIDEVLEVNAEDFVKSYVQKGGQ